MYLLLQPRDSLSVGLGFEKSTNTSSIALEIAVLRRWLTPVYNTGTIYRTGTKMSTQTYTKTATMTTELNRAVDNAWSRLTSKDTLLIDQLFELVKEFESVTSTKNMIAVTAEGMAKSLIATRSGATITKDQFIELLRGLSDGRLDRMFTVPVTPVKARAQRRSVSLGIPTPELNPELEEQLTQYEVQLRAIQESEDTRRKSLEALELELESAKADLQARRAERNEALRQAFDDGDWSLLKTTLDEERKVVKSLTNERNAYLEMIDDLRMQVEDMKKELGRVKKTKTFNGNILIFVLIVSLCLGLLALIWGSGTRQVQLS